MFSHIFLKNVTRIEIVIKIRNALYTKRHTILLMPFYCTALQVVSKHFKSQQLQIKSNKCLKQFSN